MNIHKQEDNDEYNLPVRRHSFELWFWEKRGSRYYLRLTGLGVALIFIPFLLCVVAIAAVFFHNINTPIEEPNINITVEPRPSYSPKTLINIPPSTTPSPVRSRHSVNANNPLITPTPDRNVNER
jgi:hypothetical protein